MNLSQPELIADKVEKASTLFQRMKGLLGRTALERGEGLWIEPCNSIHTFFMKFPIDVVFLSSSKHVLAVHQNLRPFRLTPWVRGAHSVLELPSGTLASLLLKTGDELALEEAS